MELDRNSILVNVVATTWNESIDKVGNILKEQGKITQEYIENMKRAVIDLGPYMVIMPGFALVHAEPNSAVIETSISLITLKSPVNFNSHNDPVHVVMCLACTDKTSHLETLSQIAIQLMREDIIEDLKKCNDVESVMECLNIV